MDGFLDHIPAVPALNRWNKVYGPLAWWTFAASFFNIIPEVFKEARSKLDDAAVVALRDLQDADVGMMTDSMWSVLKANRWRKCVTWLQRPLTASLYLPLSCLIGHITTCVLGRLLKASR